MSVDIARLGVVGGGLMGSGIAEVAARAGLPTVIREPEQDWLDRTRERILRSLDSGVARGKLTQDDRDAAFGRLSFTVSIEDLGDCDVVVEAVPEKIELKRDVFTQLDQVCKPGAILASNTSSIPIAELASATARPEQVVGLHFFSPVPVMRLLELVRALRTSDETVETGRLLGERLGKEVILTKDRAGFIVNMLLIPYLVAAVRMYEEGFASREDIDTGMRLGCAHPMGPLQLADFIGLDVTYEVCNSLFEEFKDPAYAPPPLLKRMLAAGMMGRKSGQGFYTYG
ncbi:MAG TPA: 3-hydroxybutyryl-CoA dehydrogenase [Candidatus Dormibacteraeota bacterium]|nr:3-hydroxybutyryl-CoA dehydrogenase [Candidatus Dormibacteraeota bacterium]